MKGKNFSCNNVSSKRRASDAYSTPYSLTRLLLNKVRLYGSVLEPACGEGAIVKVLKEYDKDKIKITAYDKETDFLKEKRHFDFVLTNPPFSLSEQFIDKALEVADETYFLLPLSYLHGKKRYDKYYSQGYLKRIFVFTRYPLLGDPLREDGKIRTGMMVLAFFHFTRTKNDEYPTIYWLDNNKFILSSKDK